MLKHLPPYYDTRLQTAGAQRFALQLAADFLIASGLEAIITVSDLFITVSSLEALWDPSEIPRFDLNKTTTDIFLAPTMLSCTLPQVDQTHLCFEPRVEIYLALCFFPLLRHILVTHHKIAK